MQKEKPPNQTVRGFESRKIAVRAVISWVTFGEPFGTYLRGFSMQCWQRVTNHIFVHLALLDSFQIVLHGLLDDGSLRVTGLLALFLEGINNLLRDAE